ncbi:MAG: PqqD family protein [Caldilineaceae bacterium]|nr:PqqD family protein [Caldilineaceae bacterium]
MTTITTDSRVVRASELLVANLDHETILLGVDQGAYYGLVGSAQRIWQQMERPRRVSEIIAALTARYEIDEEICQRETCAFLAQLADEGLIHILKADV